MSIDVEYAFGRLDDRLDKLERSDYRRHEKLNAIQRRLDELERMLLATRKDLAETVAQQPGRDYGTTIEGNGCQT